MKISIKKIVLTVFVAVFTCVQGFAGKTVDIGTGKTSSYWLPFDNYYKYSITQSLYKASEIGRRGTITRISYTIASDANLAEQTVKVYMAQTSKTTLTATDAITTGTLVFSGELDLGGVDGSFEPISLTTPFEYNGTDNLIIVVVRSGETYSEQLKYYCTSEAGLALHRQNDSESDCATLSNSAFAYSDASYRPNIRITFKQGYDVLTQSYEIANSEDLIWFANQVNTNHLTSLNGKVTSNFSISIGDYNTYVKKIGSYSYPYAGTFDGCDRTITISSSSAASTGSDSYKGLFGYNTGTIKNVNLTLDNVTMYGASYVGGICGYNKGTITSCDFVGKVTGTQYVGGICGYNYSGATVESCKSYDCTIEATSTTNAYVGGICGYNNGAIEPCWLYGGINVVKGANYVGGISGYNASSGTISGCETGAQQTITGKQYVGGVCGFNNGTITSPVANGASITGTQYVGGICGSNASAATISNVNLPIWSPSPVSVTATITDDKAYCGGISGANAGTIKCTYSYGYAETHADVTGYSYVGGVVGDNTGTLTRCKSIGSAKATATDSYVGGVAGHNTGTITNGVGSAVVTGKQYVGGVCGYNEAGTISAASCEKDGSAANPVALVGTTQYAGGICGYNTGTISQATNTASLTIAGSKVGAICGSNTSTGKISNSMNGNASYASYPTTITFSGQYAGGTCGYNDGGEITECTNYGALTSSSNYLGGICGYNTNSGKITDSKVENVCTATQYVGGVCGYNTAGSSITLCSNNANVKATTTGTNSYAGGIAGRNYEGTISKSYNTGIVEGRGYVGGIAGSNSKNSTNPIIEYCYNQGEVSSTVQYAGGLVGFASGELRNSYSVGTVSGTVSCGSLMGSNNSATISNLYYLEGTATDESGKVQNAIGALSAGSTTTDATTIKKKTYRHFTNGDVCYSLNSEDATAPWRQCLSSQTYPVLTGDCVVYPDAEVDGVYSNTENSSIVTAEIEALLEDFEGDGTEANPLLIPDYDHLVKFGTIVNAGYTTACGKVTADITINESVLDEDGMLRSDNKTAGLKAWKPITKYSGVFDGNNHTISGVYIYSSSEGQAFIASAVNAEIKNLTLTDCYVKGGTISAVMCANCTNSNLSNCNVSGRVESLSGFAEIGGLCAGASASKITKCSFAGSIEANSTIWVGGLCGYIDEDVQITQSYNTAKIQASSGVGGICGYIANGGSTIDRCYNTGNITNLASGEFGGTGAAGIVATVSAENTVKNCFNTGIISGYTYVGGVCGYNKGVVQYCYNAGKVNGSGNVGGVCGKKDDIGTVSYCCYDSNVCSFKGINNVDVANSAYPRTTAQLCGSASVASALYSGFSTTYWNNGTTANASTTYITEDNVLGYKIVGTYPSLVGVGEAQNAIMQYVNIGTTGTPNWISDFIPIYTIEDLKAVNNDLDATYVVMNNLYESSNLASGELKTTPTTEWVPLGSSTSAFTGKFYGRGFTISGIYMDGDYKYAGLFGYIKAATITGVKLANSHIVSTKNSSSDYGYVGGIVGAAVSYYTAGKTIEAKIEDCENSAYVNGYYAGGICGDAGYVTSAKILYCVNKGEIVSSYYAGGIVGSANTVQYCYNEGSVSSLNIAGGIAAAAATINDSYNLGYVEGKYVGGIVGGGALGANVNRSYNASELKGTASCGNLIGAAGLVAGGTMYGYYDNVLNTYTGIFETLDEIGLSEGLNTDDFCLSLPNGFSSDNWGIKEPIIKDGKKYLYYPYLKYFGENSAKLATYRAISNVVLNTNGGTCTDLTSYIEREGATLPQDVTRDGYSFGGWCTNSSCTSDEVTSIPVTAVGEQTFYAKWIANEYTVSLNANGGTIHSGDIDSYTYGTYNLLPTDVTKKGYTFAGWYEVDNDGEATGSNVADVYLESAGSSRVAVVKIIKAYNGLGLAEAKALMDKAPVTLITEMEITKATEYVEELVAAGATASLKNQLTGSATRAITVTDFGDKEYAAKWTVNTYDITLIVNGGTINSGNVTSYSYGMAKSLPTNITRTGYTFGGWYANSGCDGSRYYSVSATEIGDKIFYAKWNVQSYTVDLDVDGGTINSGDITSYTYGVGAILPTNVSKTGYTFNGWLDENDVVTTNIATDATGSKSFTADWSINDYTITYNANEGTYSGATTSYNYGDEVTLPMPTRTGYTFAGWYNNSNLVGTAFTEISDDETGDKEFWAKWDVNSYDVTLNVNDGEINSGNITKYTYDVLAILPQDVTKTGYTFGGWFDNATCDGSAITQISKGTIGDKELWAKWTAKSYTVTLQTNNGTINAGNITSYTYGVGATLPTDITKIGYTFVGWFDNSSYDGGAVTKIANNEVGNKNFWAKWTAASYSVTLIADGGTINSNNVTSYTYGVGAILPTDVTKVGYTFNGWKDAENKDALEIATDANGDKTFTASWSKATYTITYNANGGTINDTYDATYQLGSAITLPTDVVKEGCTFEGWYDNANFTGEKVTDIAATEVGNKNFYAKWKSNEYIVTLNANEGVINSGNVTSYTYGVVVSLPTNVTKDGYTFTGWYTDEACTSSVVSIISSTTTGNQTFYAGWSNTAYAVTLNTNNGIVSEGNVTSYVYGTAKALPTAEQVSKIGYTFGGWYNNSSCTGTAQTEISASETGDQEFWAKWTVNSYVISLITNGGIVNSGNVTKYTFGVGATLPGDVTKTGHTFAGWFDNEAFTGTVVDRVDEYETSAKTFFAKWTANSYAIVYETSAGTIEDATYASSYTYGEGATLPTTVSKTGYSFDGWFTNSAYEGVAMTSVTAADFGTKTFYAKWSAKSYDVTLNANEGVINNGNITSYTFGVGATLPTNVSKIGYTFAGWYDNEEFAGESVVTIPTNATNAKAFWAKWAINSYNVTFYANGGTINAGEVSTYEFGTGATLPTDVVKTGYTFAGWFDNSNLTGEKQIEISKTATGNLSFYAKWNVNSYVVALKANEGTINSGNVVAYTYGNGATLPIDVTKTGYTFGGWYEKEDLTGDAVLSISLDAYGDKTFFAKWTANSYAIVYETSAGTIEDATYASSYTYGEGATLPTTVSKTGYSFDGWFTNSAYEGVAMTSVTAADFGTKTFYAKWSAKSYDVTLNANEGIINNGNITSYTFGVGATLPTNVTKVGYTFAGWYDNEEFAGESVVTIPTNATNAKAFWAKWAINSYNVTFYANGGTINAGEVSTYEFGTGATLPTDVVKTGYTFAGWFDNSNLTGEKQMEISKTATGNLSFYAKWNVNSYAVALKANEGTINSGNVVAYTYGNGATLPIDVTKTGYTFGGWYEKEDLTGDAVLSISLDAYGDKTFFAKWTANSYKIVLVTNEGTINEGNVESYVYGEGATLPTNVTKEGYTFDGWYSNSSYIGGAVSTVANNDSGDKQFWAKWTINNYEIVANYDKAMGTINGEGSYEYKSTATLKAIANEGYEFVSWNEGVTDKTIQFVVTKDSIVVANFKEKEKVQVAGTLEIPTLKTEREAAAIDLSGLFTTTEGSAITYSATSSQPNVVSAAISEGKLYLTVYEYEGEAEITVTGTLANGETNSVKATAKVVLACNIQVAEAIKNVSCYGESDGEIALKVTNAAKPYTIQWTGETATTDTISNVKVGNYTVAIVDAEGCKYDKTYTVTQPEEMTMKATIKNPTCSNADGAIIIATTGVAEATFAWSNDATTQNLANLTKGEYALTITNAETGCEIRDTYTLTEPAAPIISVANVVATACNEPNGAVTISANEENLIYSWDNNKTTKNLTGVRAGDYVLNVVNPETNCTANLSVTVPSIALKQPEIALVTVSQETDNNLVVWLKENTDLIDFYTVYRQSEELGRYEAIAKVPYSELSVYEDTEVNPKEMPWSYKISATDVCGTETETSEAHKTMQLIRTQDPFNKKQYDLNWTAYEGLEFSSYIVMRERKINNRITIDTLKIVPSDVTTYSDTESEEGTIGYYVGIKLPSEINPKSQFMKAESGPFSIALSNIAEAENEEEPAAIDDLSAQIEVYAVGHTIYVNNVEGKSIAIYDNSGRCILQEKDADAENEYNVRLNGVYFVVIDNASFAVVVK